MSQYTQADLDAVRDAKRQLIAGTRVKSLAVRGRTFSYQEISLGSLNQLEREIRKVLYPRKRQTLLQYSKL